MPDILSEPLEELTLDQLQFHPKIREKLIAELKERGQVKLARLDNFQHRQGNVEMLEWFLNLPEKVLEEHKRAKATGR